MSEPTPFSQRVKQLVIFQLKLGLDALRDIVLSPISLICILLDWVMGVDKDNGYFARLMQFGHYSDKWINLFDAYNAQQESTNVDAWVDNIEKVIAEKRQKGELSPYSADEIKQAVSNLSAAIRPAAKTKSTETEKTPSSD